MSIVGSLRDKFKRDRDDDSRERTYSGSGQTDEPERLTPPVSDSERVKGYGGSFKKVYGREPDTRAKVYSWGKKDVSEKIDDIRTQRAEAKYKKEMKRYQSQGERTAKAGRGALKRIELQRKQTMREGSLAKAKSQIKELKEQTKEAKQLEQEYRHPTYTKIKAEAKEKAKEYGSKAYRAGYEAKENVKKQALAIRKDIGTSAGTTYLGAYSRGQAVARIRQRQDPRRGTSRARSTQSQMRPVTAPTTYSLSDRVAMESYRPSMFQSDITRQGELRQPVIEQKPPQDFLAGLGTGISSQKDYFGGGNKMTMGSTKRNSSTGLGLGLGLSKQKGDYFGLGTKKNGVLQTTKKKKVRYY